MPTVLVPVALPDWVWQKPDVREALRARNVGAIFRIVQQHGHSQGRIATACGMAQGRVKEIINGRREVSQLDVFERVAEGLAMPDAARHLLGLASNRDVRSGGQASTSPRSPKSSASTARRQAPRPRSSARPEQRHSWMSSLYAASA